MFYPQAKALLYMLLAPPYVDPSTLLRDSGKVTLSLAARVNSSGTVNVAAADRARAQAMKQVGFKGKHSVTFISYTNVAYRYLAPVGVGKPAAQCKTGRQMH
ncbi:uncharacterized protein EDB91DRAFT_1333297 [Suillus paluster]|uniref:uncharacterized protein n=1 Tax=Suillus paluster TaxID=48578 RepID=UPI001B876890|nr:uncharacterized protein EDB91DRAFT_1333297 [Suillus paluster]KAG1754008.1 hypothetical protein EDB91DRAFT_1333297 [Suillus paluster]